MVEGPLLFAVDAVRLAFVLLGVLLFVAVLWVGFALRGHRMWGCLTIAAFAAAAVYTEIDRLGHTPTVRLALIGVGTLCGLIYVAQVRVNESRRVHRMTKPRPDRHKEGPR